MSSTEPSADTSIPSGVRRLVRHLGSELLVVDRIPHTGDLVFTTKNTKALVEALVDVFRNPDADDELSLLAALMLGRGKRLIPLEYVLPALAPLLIEEDEGASRWAAVALDAAARTGDSEQLSKQPSDPAMSLRRIAEQFPEHSDLVDDVVKHWNREGYRRIELT
jgi:hypothetical protein